MGFLHSIIRFLCCQTEDEETTQRPIYPYAILHQKNNGDSSQSSERLPKIFIFHRLICRAVNGILQKVRFLFYRPRPRKAADPILPIQNPGPTTCNDSLLRQNLLISPPISNDSSSPESEHTAFALFADSNTDHDQEYLQCDNVDFDVDVDVVSSQQWAEENYLPYRRETDTHVVISIRDDFTHSLAYTSASEEMTDSAVVITEEIAPEQSMGIMNSSDGKARVEEQREEEKLMIKSNVVVVDEGRWIKHYSSRHRILLVGEGDFSFSACLALVFGSASNMIATSLDSKAFLRKNYENAPANIKELRSRGCKVVHGIDATKMANHALLGHLTFDRIIYNFPHAGFFKDLSRESLLRRHRRLVSLFMKNARKMISENGEIHISHKTNEFHIEWKLEMLASSHRLRLIEEVKFNRLEYPGYNTKYGFGGDNNFNCNPSKTYKFGLKKGVRY